MVNRPGARGVLSRLLGVVPDHEVVRTPDLETRQEQEAQWLMERAERRGERPTTGT